MTQEGRSPNVLATEYYLAQVTIQCWYCAKQTKVVAVAVPSGHQILELEERRVEGDAHRPTEVWQRSDLMAFLFYIGNLNAPVLNDILQISSNFRFAHSSVTLDSYWANHCEHCGSMLEDHELHCEPDMAFVPASESRARCVRISRMAGSLEAAADGYALEPQFFDVMGMD
jgi:hypothetical protein